MPLYKNAGHLSGAITFQHLTGQSDFSGTVTWEKPASSKAQGFTATSQLIGSLFSPGLPALSLAAPATALFIGPGVTGTATFNGLSQVGSRVKTTGLSLTINQSNGVVTGTFLPPGGKKTFAVYGVVFQDQDVADGYFVDPDGEGEFMFGD